jgi:hypothetical protein
MRFTFLLSIFILTNCNQRTEVVVNSKVTSSLNTKKNVFNLLKATSNKSTDNGKLKKLNNGFRGLNFFTPIDSLDLSKFHKSPEPSIIHGNHLTTYFYNFIVENLLFIENLKISSIELGFYDNTLCSISLYTIDDEPQDYNGIITLASEKYGPANVKKIKKIPIKSKLINPPSKNKNKYFIPFYEYQYFPFNDFAIWKSDSASLKIQFKYEKSSKEFLDASGSRQSIEIPIFNFNMLYLNNYFSSKFSNDTLNYNIKIKEAAKEKKKKSLSEI